jgi:pyruvate/2-oxoglutarate dehydrogenase complex dihydrolipoamide dehydrogenase (E3) component
VIIGAGSGGLTAAGFAAQLGAKVALVEKNRIGGDCTWTGCVPSKALLKVARVAHEVRTASQYGVHANAPVVAMEEVRRYVQSAIQEVYRFESPEELSRQGIDVVLHGARFLDPQTIAAGERIIRAKRFLLTTGARPVIPTIAGLNEVPFITYEQIFENSRLPDGMIVVGAGPIGMEMAQAYRRLGCKVSVVASQLLPKDEPEVREVMQRVFEREGIEFVRGKALSARRVGDACVVATDQAEVRGDLLLIAAGRKPGVEGLDLEKAGVNYSATGIPVDDRLRTNVKHIFAAGDVTGGHQFTHFAGWQAFQAVRNALLPGGNSGFSELVPWVTFTDPEVAHVGMREDQARVKFGDSLQVRRWDMSHADRAVCENDTHGFIKLIATRDGSILGATIVAARAGEAITELIVAMKHHLKIADLASAIHAYPTYSTAVQQLAADMAVENMLAGTSGRIVRRLSKIVR